VLKNIPLVGDYQELNAPSWLFTESVKKAFWRVRHWEAGTTEQGSSGSPLFNQNKMIVGNLTGGDATCANPLNDYFSKFHMQWNYYPDSSKQLKYWLDSLKTGVSELTGSEPVDPEIPDYIERYTLYPNPASDIVTFKTDSLDISEAVITIYSLTGACMSEYNISGENKIIMDVSFLQNGMYIFEYRNRSFVIRKRLLIIR